MYVKIYFGEALHVDIGCEMQYNLNNAKYIFFENNGKKSKEKNNEF